jgi:hypothetical protein
MVAEVILTHLEMMEGLSLREAAPMIIMASIEETLILN